MICGDIGTTEEDIDGYVEVPVGQKEQEAEAHNGEEQKLPTSPPRRLGQV